MQKSHIINLYKDWLRILYPLKDIDFQRRAWFQLEGTEESTFEEATGNFLDRYDVLVEQYKDQNNSKENINIFANLIKELNPLHEKINNFLNEDESILNSVFEQKLLSDQNWLQIVATSQRIWSFLKYRIEEVEHAEG